jgi:hypothetical protein
MFCNGTRLIPIAGIERRLAAAGLALGIIDFAAETFEDLDNAYPNMRINLINEAGDKERDLHNGV